MDIKSDTWTSGSSIVLSVDGLTIGTYGYVITVYDTSGNSASDTVSVQVTEIPTDNEDDESSNALPKFGNIEALIGLSALGLITLTIVFLRKRR